MSQQQPSPADPYKAEVEAEILPPQDNEPWPWQPGIPTTEEARRLARLVALLTFLTPLGGAAALAALYLPREAPLAHGGLGTFLALASLVLFMAAAPMAVQLYSRLWHHARAAVRPKSGAALTLLFIPGLNLVWLPLGLPLLALGLGRSLRRAGRPRSVAPLLAMPVGAVLGLCPLAAFTSIFLAPGTSALLLAVSLGGTGVLAPLYFALVARACVVLFTASSGNVARDPNSLRAWGLGLGLAIGAPLAALTAIFLAVPLLDTSVDELENLARAHMETAKAACDLALSLDILENQDFHCAHAMEHLDDMTGEYMRSFQVLVEDAEDAEDADGPACRITVTHSALGTPLTSLWVPSAPALEDLEQLEDVDPSRMELGGADTGDLDAGQDPMSPEPDAALPPDAAPEAPVP